MKNLFNYFKKKFKNAINFIYYKLKYLIININKLLNKKMIQN